MARKKRIKNKFGDREQIKRTEVGKMAQNEDAQEEHRELAASIDALKYLQKGYGGADLAALDYAAKWYEDKAMKLKLKACAIRLDWVTDELRYGETDTYYLNAAEEGIKEVKAKTPNYWQKNNMGDLEGKLNLLRIKNEFGVLVHWKDKFDREKQECQKKVFVLEPEKIDDLVKTVAEKYYIQKWEAYDFAREFLQAYIGTADNRYGRNEHNQFNRTRIAMTHQEINQLFGERIMYCAQKMIKEKRILIKDREKRMRK